MWPREMNKFEPTKKTNILLYGLAVAIGFIYLNDLIFVCRLKPDHVDQFVVRSIPSMWRDILYALWKISLCLSLPAGMLAGRFYEPYFTEVVYYPFLAGPVWFGYGCLLRWAWVTKRTTVALTSLLIIWIIFLYFGWTMAIF